MRRLATHLLVALSLVVLGANVAAAAMEEFESPVNLGPVVNSTAEDLFPFISTDGLRLLFRSDRDGGELDAYIATRSSPDDPFGAPVELGDKINAPGSPGLPFESRDGLKLYFQKNDQKTVATRTAKSVPWDDPSVGLDTSPFSQIGGMSLSHISPDGSTLIGYQRNLGAPWGNDWELVVSSWSAVESEWDPIQVVDVDSKFGGNGSDIQPSFSPDGLTVFFGSQNRTGAPGQWDIWSLTRPDASTPWSDVGELSLRLARGINTADGLDLRPFFYNGALYFHTNHQWPGHLGERDIYRSLLVPEPCTFVLWAALGLIGLACGARRRKR